MNLKEPYFSLSQLSIEGIKKCNDCSIYSQNAFDSENRTLTAVHRRFAHIRKKLSFRYLLVFAVFHVMPRSKGNLHWSISKHYLSKKSILEHFQVCFDRNETTASQYFSKIHLQSNFCLSNTAWNCLDLKHCK